MNMTRRNINNKQKFGIIVKNNLQLPVTTKTREIMMIKEETNF